MSQSTGSVETLRRPTRAAVRLTPRDLDSLRTLDAAGGLTAGDLAIAEGRDVSGARRRLRLLVTQKLARGVAPWAGEAPIYVPTRAGLLLARERDDLAEPELSAGSYAHQRALGHALAQLQAARVVAASERLIRRNHREFEPSKPWQLTVRGSGHLPDAIYWPDGYTAADPGRGSVALEIELSRKGGPRVRAVLDGYELHHRIERVVYLAAPAALPALTKAIAAGAGGGKAVALPLTGECPPLGGPALPAVRGRATGPAT